MRQFMICVMIFSINSVVALIIGESRIISIISFPKGRIFMCVNERMHKNKYAIHSKNIEDPLRIAIRNSERRTEQSHTLLERGTTVPTITGSPINKKIREFQDISKIVPTDPYTFGFIRIGVIAGPHGVKGEVKAQIETDFADTRFRKDSILYLKRPYRKTPRPIKILSGRRQKEDTYLLLFEGISSRLHANIFKGYVIYVRAEDRPTLASDEYLVRDLVGMLCYTESLVDSKAITAESSHIFDKFLGTNVIGEVCGVVPPEELCSPGTAALMHAMIELRLYRDSSDSKHRAGDIPSSELCLIPLVPDIVTVVDVENKRILIRPPEGLLELTYREKEEKKVIRGFLPAVAGLTDIQRKQLINDHLFSEVF